MQERGKKLPGEDSLFPVVNQERRRFHGMGLHRVPRSGRDIPGSFDGDLG